MIRPAESLPAGLSSLIATLGLALVLTAGVSGVAPRAAAQGLVGGSGQGPLEIEASDGIEWRRDEQVYIARGNASASRGGVTVYADRLIAHYRKTDDGAPDDGSGAGGSGAGESDDGAGLSTGSTQIYRIEGVGSVRIVDQRSTAQGDKAVYDLDQQVIVLTGDNLRFKTDQETITAEDSLEYWQARDLAVARGDANATRDDRVIQADVLAARFAPEENGGGARAGDGGGSNGGSGDGAGGDGAGGAPARQQQIERIEAFDNVRISTPNEFARGNRGVYNTRTEIATLTGNVRITRGENQLNGGWGQVNLRTGVSRLRGAPPEAGGDTRVRALLQPDSARDISPSDTARSEARDTAADEAAPAAGGAGASEGQSE